MKIFILSAVLLLFHSLGAFAEISLPKRPFWDPWVSHYLSSASREQRMQLAALFPKIFGFEFVCQFKSGPKGTGTPVTVVPGEVLDAPEGGVLHCPNDYNFLIDKQSRLTVSQVELVPRIFLEKGKLEGNFGKSVVMLETARFSLTAVGLGYDQKLILEATESAQIINCLQGDIYGNLDPREGAAAKAFLASQSCRMSLAYSDGKVTRSIFANDRVQLENLILSRKFWPYIPPFGESFSFVAISLLPPAADVKKIRIGWNLVVENKPVSCRLFTQKTEADAAQEISKFEAKALSGEVGAEISNNGSLAFLLCDIGKEQTFSSNILQLTAPSAPVPVAASPAPTAPPPAPSPQKK